MIIEWWRNKWFTLMEIIIVITILSILSTVWVYNLWSWNTEQYLQEYKDKVETRVDTLYKKGLIWINWYYNNNGETEAEYIKLYCNQNDKTFLAYICDSSNITTPNFNNCKQIDFPTLTNIEYWWVLSKYTKETIEIENCRYIDIWGSSYTNWSFYLTISTIFPNWKIEAYKENMAWTIDNINDDTAVDNVMIKVKEGVVVKEIYPISFN